MSPVQNGHMLSRGQAEPFMSLQREKPQKSDRGVTGIARDRALRASQRFFPIQNPKSKIQNRSDPQPKFSIHYPRYQFYEVDLWWYIVANNCFSLGYSL